MGNWENEPATEKQKAKLRYFGCTWEGDITKGQASKAIDECVRSRPDLEESYQQRPATQEQVRELRRQLKGTGKRPNDYAEDGEGLAYQEAKELIEELKLEETEAEFDRMDKEYIVDVDMWSDLYPGLTWKRVQAAAESLDELRPGWRSQAGHFDVMLEKVAEQNPQLLERWRKKASPRRSAPKHRGRRRSKNNSIGVVIVLLIAIWIAFKIISKAPH